MHADLQMRDPGEIQYCEGGEFGSLTQEAGAAEDDYLLGHV